MLASFPNDDTIMFICESCQRIKCVVGRKQLKGEVTPEEYWGKEWAKVKKLREVVKA